MKMRTLYKEYSPELMKAAGSYEASKGTAYVRFYNNGSFHDYEIDITDLKYGDSKNITFKVTSGELLKLTNGIVQDEWESDYSEWKDNWGCHTCIC